MNTLTEKAKHIKATVSLTDFLNRLGFQPHGKPAKETMYISMLRESDTNASFSVNEKLGCWYDHGLGKGGNIIDFAQAYWKNMSFKETIEKIESICNLNLGKIGYPLNPRPRIKLAVKLPNYKIQEIKPFSSTEGINAYLKSRGVFSAAEGLMQEIHYYVEDEKKNRKNYFAAGWQNEVGGWEVRNKYFKGCLGKKGITLLPGDNRQVAVFEGFFNYLSWRTENPTSGKSILVLNSLALIDQGIDKAKQYSDIDVYMDHDPAGHTALKQWLSALPYSRDKSSVYNNFNDYNDKIKADLKAERMAGLIKR
jgi:hypothetical protein